MTPAEHARNAAITLEAKKDTLSQRQSNDWKISFTVQASDMDARLTKAPMGTRFAMVLVEIGDDELPVDRKVAPAKPSEETKRNWRDMQPAAQAGIRCSEAIFRAFLNETRQYQTTNPEDAAEAVREICGVHSRVELGTKHAARMIWKQLDDEFDAWKAMERA